MDIGLVIDYLRPGAKYTRYKTYQDLVDTWDDETTLPTEQEMIDAEADALAAIEEVETPIDRISKLERALIKKGTLTKKDVDDEKPVKPRRIRS